MHMKVPPPFYHGDSVHANDSEALCDDNGQSCFSLQKLLASCSSIPETSGLQRSEIALCLVDFEALFLKQVFPDCLGVPKPIQKYKNCVCAESWSLWPGGGPSSSGWALQDVPVLLLVQFDKSTVWDASNEEESFRKKVFWREALKIRGVGREKQKYLLLITFFCDN